MLTQEEIAQYQNVLAMYRRTLTHLLSQQAQFSTGYVPPAVANGISEAREYIRQIKAILRANVVAVEDQFFDEPLVLQDSSIQNQPVPISSGAISSPHVLIYLPGDLPSLTDERRSAAIAAFAAVMGISPGQIQVYRIYEGSIVFELGMPINAMLRLHILLEMNDEQLRALRIKQVVFERSPDTIEMWVDHRGTYLSRRVAAGNPYLGLSTFQETDADRFFGRDVLVAELLELVRRAPFLAVLGSSGSGKSSVVRAGLIPALKRGALPYSEQWIYCPPLIPGTRPLDSLATVLTSTPGGAALGSVFDLQKRLASQDDALLMAADTLRNGNTEARLVLLIDQAEQLWTLAPAEPEARATFIAQQQRPFIQQILSALPAPGSPLLIIFTMRADFLHRAAEYPALARAIGEHDLIVSPMTADELREAIVRPAEAAGGSFEPGLVDELIEQTLNRPGALPLLEYTLLELWNDRRPDGALTWETYRTLGGVEGPLAQTADAVLAEKYTPEQQKQLRDILLRLVQLGEGAVDTRQRVRLEELVPAEQDLADVQVLLTPLADERLLTTGYDMTSGSETVEVAHEALIRAWRTFGEWISANREDLRFRLQLSAAAQEWIQAGESSDFLWSGLRLANAEEWLARAQPALNARDRWFLEASRAAARARAAAEEANRRHVLRLHKFLMLEGVLLLVALGLLLYTINR